LNDDPKMNKYRIVDFYAVPYSLSNFDDFCKYGVDIDTIFNRTEQKITSGPIIFSYDVVFKVLIRFLFFLNK